MREAKATFLMFLNDNLTTLTPPVSVHAMRKDPDDPSSDKLQMNSVNVGFGRVEFAVNTTCLYTKIDVIADSELVATDIVQSVWRLLSKRFYTEGYDYTDPSNPVLTGTTLMWKPDKVKFSPAQYEKDDRYYRYSCTLPIEYHNAFG